MSEDALKYLQRDDIGKVIAKGLASVYSKRPPKPVKYLAEWLKSYSGNRAQLSHAIQAQHEKTRHSAVFENTQKLVALSEQEKLEESSRQSSKIRQFEDMIASHEYQEELLEEVLPEFIEKYTGVTGVYVGELNHPPIPVTDEDKDQNAHLNLKADKVINYVGSSVSHKHLMRGRTLHLSQGVTAKAFELAQQEPPVNSEEGGQKEARAPRPAYVYIPNVVKNESMHYFRIPRLGAYLAVPLVCKSYLRENIFDEVLQERKKQLQEHNEFAKKKHQELEELAKNREQLNKKLTELRDKHADEAQVQQAAAEAQEIDLRIAQKQAEQRQEAEIHPNFIKTSYVVCADNLGKDEELTPHQITFIVGLVEHFRNSWESKELSILFKDINTQIEFLHLLPADAATIKSGLEKECQLDEDALKEVGQIEDEFLRTYKQDEEELNRLRTQLNSNPLFLESFLKLKEFRVIKYKQLLQNMLYFIGEAKAQINLAGRAGLNWKRVRSQYITKETFNRILNYIVEGPKDKPFHFYSKTPALQKQFDELNENDLFSYNVGLGALTVFIKKALRHRVSNVKLRKLQKEAERVDRSRLIEENAKLDELKVIDLKEHKDKLQPDEVEGFKQQQWVNNFQKLHPKHEIPSEVIDDIDNDM